VDPRDNPYTPNAGAQPPALAGRENELINAMSGKVINFRVTRRRDDIGRLRHRRGHAFDRINTPDRLFDARVGAEAIELKDAAELADEGKM
jgi:hypothetical protein